MSYREQLGRIMQDVCASTLGARAQAREPEYAAQLETLQTMSSQVAITGAWNGALTIVCPIALATKMAEAMFGMESSEMSEAEVGDALGELTSLVGKNFTAQMAGRNELLLPSVVKGREVAAGNVTCVLTFASDDLPFQVTVSESGAS